MAAKGKKMMKGLGWVHFGISEEGDGGRRIGMQEGLVLGYVMRQMGTEIL